MGKKRRVWWVVGGFVVAVALFAAIAFYIDYNSTDARIERAVAQIVEEYGFELQGQMPGYVGPPLGGGAYSRAPVSAETEDEIVAILRGACPSCDYNLRVTAANNIHTTGEQTVVEHVIFRLDQGDGLSDGLVFAPDNKDGGLLGAGPGAILLVIKFERPSLWQRIKGLWPW
ncbi:MAG: hypothetical protein IH945_14045 [Armatimonadetes bacterium]|nr:hypothetical protein [Armatimonadota bacterium]